MVRIWAVALAVLAICPLTAVAQTTGDKDTASDKEFKVEGKLTDDDPKDKVTKTASNVRLYKMKAKEAYVIRMASDEVDAFLRLENSDGKQLALNDDEGPGTFNSKIVFKCEKDGEYKIIATCFPQPTGNLKLTGKYTLTVGKASKEEVNAAYPHDALIGKAAPEVVGEFAINGKAKKLSDLKGKVVLLDFWAVWCGPCIATFPHLRDWHKEFGKEGLVILGATTYYQKYDFDSDKGQLAKAEEALKPADEHVMISTFAKYHKLAHELLVLSKENWSKAGKDYVVQGIPTVVLIDRRGEVRMVRVGSGDENAQLLEEEIKKLLAEK
jgi:thiol-disulfide isomerase/thioredoxin